MNDKNVRGLQQWVSSIGPDVLVTRMEAQLEKSRFTLFGRIDHAHAARSAGLFLPFCTVLIFGRPSGGTELMRVFPTLAIDLPSKILVYQREADVSVVAFTDLSYTVERHGLQGDRLLAQVDAFDREVHTIISTVLTDSG
ncbi:DUF302 domain-containing protein [Acidithiobacillus caldus]|jgi:uncharacterized protein (DUF302 family)|uniref:DUF302 domain-containing protein n=1 Tax=Acidithiobacillus caldus TaxID=33059 RepID=A0A1E7Z000_9PROT|nr:DUF302 domain-containing protein [Acidithiobacillus caldus]AUW33146.1 DUF302 domain-containing protein [Acidithiobacillus caldus]MBU2729470.1 DUF302 domain-containing protein [Acidithiobacillus caldus]MBU2735148.1 DUF302 domain-containing protein [Acidithiobacillus caldus ATCC 51756]MBU2745368.1 DUF302 domain-containing protein [Acidithiobacillus caldus]MBU2763036.1 DUF302 domain-containing protein [Acidithiobacillus caldus]